MNVKKGTWRNAAVGAMTLLMTASGLSQAVEAADSESSTAVAVESPFTIDALSAVKSDFSLTDESVPADALPVNCVFSVRGQISSSFALEKVWGGVYHEDGTPTSVYYEDTPDTTSYNLNTTFDNYLDFGALGAGHYTYKIEATDARGTTETLIEKAFDIVDDDSAPSEIQVYAASYPTGTLMKGKGFGIKGRVYSTYVIQSVSCGVYKAEGSECAYQNQFAFTVDGGKRSYNLNLLDSSILFDLLPVGEYVYKVTVTDVMGYTKELISSPFRIRSSDSSDNDTQVMMKGIDVSANNEITDWDKVYADGTDFSILRAGYTYDGDENYHPDTAFEDHYENAKKAGLKIGVYLYTSAINKSELKADIDALVKDLDGKELDMPVYIDVEAKRQTTLSKAALTDLLTYGCRLLTDYGYKAGVYSSYNWFRDYIDANALSKTGCEIWLAFLPNDPNTVNLSDFCVTWQYCSDGTVDGITGNVDQDYRYAALSLETYGITLNPPETGTVSADKTAAACGERVTVTVTTDRLHKVKSVTYNGYEASCSADGSYSFTMPETAVEVSVELEECDPSETADDFGIITDMPVPFGTAGDTAPYHAKPCSERLSTLPEAVMNLASGGSSWDSQYNADKPKWALTLMDYANIYSFIHDHDLDPEKVRAVLSDGDKMLHRVPFTDEEIDVLLGDDEAKAMEMFASPSTIVIGNKGYSARWMYYHTPDEYAAEGIAPEMVKAVMPNYYNPLYVQEAADAFSQKLYKYTSQLTQTKYRQWLAGDVDLSGSVDKDDADLLKDYLAYTQRLQFANFASADMNADSLVDDKDLILLEELIEKGADSGKSVSLDVIEFCQYPDYPTGCESVSLYMLLNYYGVDVTVNQIYDLLPMGPLPYYEDGIKYGANPEREFVGNPRSYDSFGVYNEPIADVAEQFKSGVVTETNASIEKIKSILDTGNPVLAWYVSAPMRRIMYRRSWLDYQTGELVRWPGGEHAVVICGYDETSLTYRDPNSGTTVIIDYDTFSKSYTELGSRIVYYTDQINEPDETTTTTTNTETSVTPESSTTTETTASPITTDDYFASVERMCEMSVNDYEQKNGTAPSDAQAVTNEDGSVSITLTNSEGNVLDIYVIDPKTGEGTDSSGDEVNLPQTGNHAKKNFLLAIAAVLMIVLGSAATAFSGILRRRKHEE